LDPDGLYIATVALTNSFHWSLIHVDRDGAATGHHWAATTSNPHGPEGYMAFTLSTLPPSDPRVKRQQVLGYFKVPAWPPSIEAAALHDACNAAIPRSSPSALQNRAANLNSRTWVTRVLARLHPEHASEVEDFVLRHSRVFGDEAARSFLFNKPYPAAVLTV
ncbi:uncharacterized protein BXZ73DRAFT_7661, partial [Epithele typhae]|uniref:uncharacterized protein n=1 Tax=Epithele typhae TaxID=378194 RepID=UPI00200772FF